MSRAARAPMFGPSRRIRDPSEGGHVAQPCPPLALDRAPAVPPDHGGSRAGGRRRADHRPDHDQHRHLRRGGHGRAGPGLRRGRRRHRARLGARRGLLPRAARHRAREPGADRRRHPLPLPPRARVGRGRGRVPQDQPRQHRLEGAGARGRAGRARSRLRHPHRRQRGLAGAASPGEVRRALSRGDGRVRPGAHPHPGGSRLPRVQDLGEGVRRVPGGRRLPAARRGHRRADPPRHHGGRLAQRGHRALGDRARQPAVDGHRRPRCGCRSRPIRSRRCASASRS